MPRSTNAKRSIENRLVCLNIRDHSQETACHYDSITACLKCCISKVRNTLTLSGDFYPERNSYDRTHCINDICNTCGIKFSRYRTLRCLAGIRCTNVEFQHAQAGGFYLLCHGDGMLQIGEDQARNNDGVVLACFVIKPGSLFKPGVEGLGCQTRTACDKCISRC